MFAANGFLGLCVTLALRVNINVAIVAMVNGTAVYVHDNKTKSEECAAGSVANNGSSEDTPHVSCLLLVVVFILWKLNLVAFKLIFSLHKVLVAMLHTTGKTLSTLSS